MKLFHNNDSFLSSQASSSTLNSSGLDVSKLPGFSILSSVLDSTPGAKTFVDGVAQVDTLNFPAKAGTTASDYVVITAQDGTTYAAAVNKTGSDTAPTGAAWLAVAAGRRVQVDISASTSAADVATAFKTALNGVTGFSGKITASDAAADGHLSLTQAIRGVVTHPVPHNANDSGAGLITTAATTAGVDSKVDVSANTIAIASHGYLDGLKLQASSTGTLPAGITTATNYFVIVVDSNTIKLATSLSNALAGTAIDLTDQGTSGATGTLTPTTTVTGTILLQASNDDITYVTISGSSQNISGAGSFFWNVSDVFYKFVRLQQNITVGQGTVSANITSKVENDLR
jgi:hypothetical protein